MASSYTTWVGTASPSYGGSYCLLDTGIKSSQQLLLKL